MHCVNSPRSPRGGGGDPDCLAQRTFLLPTSAAALRLVSASMLICRFKCRELLPVPR